MRAHRHWHFFRKEKGIWLRKPKDLTTCLHHPCHSNAYFNFPTLKLEPPFLNFNSNFSQFEICQTKKKHKSLFLTHLNYGLSDFQWNEEAFSDIYIWLFIDCKRREEKRKVQNDGDLTELKIKLTKHPQPKSKLRTHYSFSIKIYKAQNFAKINQKKQKPISEKRRL